MLLLWGGWGTPGAAPPGPAFQCDAFQLDAFQMDPCPVVAPPTVPTSGPPDGIARVIGPAADRYRPPVILGTLAVIGPAPTFDATGRIDDDEIVIGLVG